MDKYINEMSQHVIGELKSTREQLNNQGSAMTERYSQVSSRISALKGEKTKIEQKIMKLQMDDSTDQIEDEELLKKRQTQLEGFKHQIQMEENGRDERESNELTE